MFHVMLRITPINKLIIYRNVSQKREEGGKADPVRALRRVRTTAFVVSECPRGLTDYHVSGFNGGYVSAIGKHFISPSKTSFRLSPMFTTCAFPPEAPQDFAVLK